MRYIGHKSVIGVSKPLKGLAEIFKGKRDKSRKDNEELVKELYQQIGRLAVES